MILIVSIFQIYPLDFECQKYSFWFLLKNDFNKLIYINMHKHFVATHLQSHHSDVLNIHLHLILI